MIKYLVLSLLIFSCAQKPPAEKLFPYGLYHHQVSLNVKGSAHNFTGVNKWTPEQLTLVALGAFDVTLIKYSEDLVTFKQEIYVDPNFLPLTDEKAKAYLAFMKNFYSLDRSICKDKVCRKSFYGMEFFIHLNDAKAVKDIKFERGDVKVNIQVVGYEKIP